MAECLASGIETFLSKPLRDDAIANLRGVAVGRAVSNSVHSEAQLVAHEPAGLAKDRSAEAGCEMASRQ